MSDDVITATLTTTTMRSHVLIAVTKSMLTFLWTLMQRIFCCKRKRRPSKGHGSKDEWSEEEGEAMLTSVTVESSDHSGPIHSWNSWPEERESTVADRIEAYRASLKQVQAQEEVTPVENLDFFTDMTPQVSRQTKVYVGPSIKNPSASRLGVLGATTDVDTDTLGTWDESSGWDAEDEGLSQLMREQRRQQKRLNSK